MRIRIMILFCNGNLKAYNYVIHHFLELEVFNGDNDIGDIIEETLPKYLYREQYQKCVKTYEDLFYWTGDTFFHQMKGIHEFVLYKFLEYMAELQEDILNFSEIYFDDKCRKLIDEASKTEYEINGFDDDIEEEEEFSLDEYKSMFFDVEYYLGTLFEDIDFLLIDSLYNNRRLGNTSIEQLAGINIDYYFDLLPLDIQDQYKTKHITLTSEVSAFLDYLDHRIQHGDLYKLFRNGDEPVKEERIQII